MVSDPQSGASALFRGVSIRFEVRGGFRRGVQRKDPVLRTLFQSALRFAVVSD